MYSQNHFIAIASMLIGIAVLVTMDAVAKVLVTDDALSPILLIGIRSIIIVTLIVAYLAITKQTAQLIPKRPIAQLARGAIGFLAPVCFFMSLKTLPLVDATVIFFSSTFIITALSWPLLKERVGVHRWSAVVIGFAGVVVAMQPQGGGVSISYLYCFISSVAYALLFISGRYLSKTESIISLVLTFNIGTGLVCLTLFPWIWQPVSGLLILKIFGFSLLAVTGHICMTAAFSRAPVSVIAPFEYTGVVWAVLIGYFWFGDLPNTRVVLGAVIIIACGLYVIYRESISAKNQTG